MAIPSEKDFEVISELALDNEDWNDLGIYEPNQDSFHEFSSLMHEKRTKLLEELYKSVAYKWLTNQLSWKYASKFLFKNDHERQLSREEYISSLVSSLDAAYQPHTNEEYQNYREFELNNMSISQRIQSTYGHELFENSEVKIPYPIMTLEEINSSFNRLERFKNRLYIIRSELIKHELEVKVLMCFRDYFYDDGNYVNAASTRGAKPYDLQEYKEKSTILLNAYQGIEYLKAYLQKQLFLTESFDENGVDKKKYIDLQIEMEELKVGIESDFHWAQAELNLYSSNEPLIKRTGGTDKVRVLAYFLWLATRGYVNSRPVEAIQYLLQIAGCSPEREDRIIHRWIEGWEAVEKRRDSDS